MTRQPTDTVIQLLVADDADRTALTELLEERYDIVSETDELRGDLLLVEDRSFDRYRDQIATAKDPEAPSFTPVVLVCRPETTVDRSLLQSRDGDAEPLVDEVVEAPVRKHILVRRLENLLARQTQFRRLEAQNERLEQFASVVSHDLRNPIQIINGRLELLESTCSESDREHFEAIEESVARMESLVDNVLTLARQGSLADDVSATDLSDVVDEAWGVVETADATLSVPEQAAVILADRDHLRSIFENLFRNAFEHAGREVTVDVGVFDDGFYVADDGPGIPPDERATVLERGYSTADDGTGLGLDIVTNVVDAHGWDVSLEESDAGGVRFEITGVTRVDQSPPEPDAR